MEQRNKFIVGDTLELMKAHGQNVTFTVESIETEDGESVESAPHPKQRLYLKLPVAAESNEIIRKVAQ